MTDTDQMSDSDYEDEDLDLDYDEAHLSPQMRAQMDRLLGINKGFGVGGRSRPGRAGPIRRRIEDWHDNRAVDRSLDYLNDRLD